MQASNGRLGRALVASLLCLGAIGTPVAAEARPAANTNWALLGNSHDMQHYSALDQINRTSVAKLGLQWSVDIPTGDGLVGNPLIRNGIIFQSGARGFVVANDLRTGRTLWTFTPRHDFSRMSIAGLWGSNFNRGVALYRDLVIVASDCALIALDQATGKERWVAQSCDPTRMYAITAAPRVGAGLVFTGNACMDSGETRGYVDAFDARTGTRVWRFYTVPGDPAKPDSAFYRNIAKSWGEDWYSKTHGCGSVWDAITYDSELKQLYIGVDGPAPFPPSQRGRNAGDELFTNSVVALDARTGQYLWHFKLVPHDGWNYTPTGIMIANVPLGGVMRRVVLTVPKNGFVYMLDARTGKFLQGRAYMAENWAKRLDSVGRPIFEPKAKYWDRPDRMAVVYPSSIGGHGFEAMAFDPHDDVLYIPSEFAPMKIGMDPTSLVGSVSFDWYFGKGYGEVVAWDVIAQRAVWRATDAHPVVGGLLATAGDLVFQGTASGRFLGYDAKTGRVLWSHETGSAIRAAPSTVMLNGRQYLIVASGNGSSSATGSFLSRYSTTHRSRSPPRLLAFALGGRAAYPPLARADEVPAPAHERFGPALVAKGRRLFEGSGCLECHGIAGDSVGGTVPNLVTAPPTLGLLKAAVQSGALLQYGMPHFSDMTNADIEALYAYLIECGWNAYEEGHGGAHRH